MTTERIEVKLYKALARVRYQVEGKTVRDALKNRVPRVGDVVRLKYSEFYRIEEVVWLEDQWTSDKQELVYVHMKKLKRKVVDSGKETRT